MIPTRFIGDPWALPVQVLQDGAAYPLTGKTVTARLGTTAGVAIAGPTACDPAHAEADPPAGVAVAAFTAEQTALIPARGQVLVQVLVDGVVWNQAAVQAEPRIA
jgi:hypothetical protein